MNHVPGFTASIRHCTAAEMNRIMGDPEAVNALSMEGIHPGRRMVWHPAAARFQTRFDPPVSTTIPAPSLHSGAFGNSSKDGEGPDVGVVSKAVPLAFALSGAEFPNSREQPEVPSD